VAESVALLVLEKKEQTCKVHGIIMSEVGGITELQMLQAEAASLKKELEGVQNAETISVSCKRIAAAVQEAKGMDGFLVTEAGAVEKNQFHTSASASAQGGCCVVL
jgi:hypothetical protein